MDSTLIVPKSGAKFPKGRKDWVWWNPSVVKKLAEKNKAGFKIVIFTNQAGIEKKNQKGEDIMGKILDLSAEVYTYIFIFCYKNWPVGISNSIFCGCCNQPLEVSLAALFFHKYSPRKPNTTMWDYMIQQLNQGVKVGKNKAKEKISN